MSCLELKFIPSLSVKGVSHAVNNLIIDIQAEFEKYIWPKSNVFTKAQDGILTQTLLYIRNKIHNTQVAPPNVNYSQKLKIALSALKEDPTIIIAKADKGDTVVVLDSAHSYSLAAKHLADARTYELLETDPSEEILEQYHQYLGRCVEDGVLDDYQYRRLIAPQDYQ